MTASSDTPPPESPEPIPPKRPRRRFLLFGGLGLAALGSLFAARGWAQRGRHGGFGPFGPFGHRHHGGHASAEELRAHLGKRADRVLGYLDASDAQHAQIAALLDDLAPQLYKLQERGRALHAEAHGAFGSGDRAALELARQRGIALLDGGSALVLTSAQQAYAVLDEEQRATVRKHWQRFGGSHAPPGAH